MIRKRLSVPTRIRCEQRFQNPQRTPANGRPVELARFKPGRIFAASSRVVDIPGGTQIVVTLNKS